MWDGTAVYRGRLAGPDDIAAVEVFCNGAPIGCHPFLVADGAIAGGLAAVEFEIELPGYIWVLQPGRDECVIDIKYDGVPLESEPQVITTQGIIDWTGQLLAKAPSIDVPRLMLAIEHVRYGGLLKYLTPAVRKELTEFARGYGLVDFLLGTGSAGNVALAAPVDAADEPWQTFADSFRTALADDSRTAAEHLAALTTGLAAAQREQWTLRLVPLFCQREEFAQIEVLVSDRLRNALYAAEDAASLSLAIPFLVEAGNVARANNLMWKLVKTGGEAMAPDCIVYAARRVLTSPQSLADEQAVHKFVYALLGVIGAMSREARLSDAVVDVGALLMARAAGFTDFLQHDLHRALLRLWGMSRRFWSLCGDYPPLHYAAARFRRIDAACKLPAITEAQLPDVLAAAWYFQEQGCVEAVEVLRCLTNNAITERTLPMRDGEPAMELSRLCALEEQEALRAACVPGGGWLAPDSYAPQLPAVIRKQFHITSRSPLYGAQREAARLLESMQQQAQTGDDAGLQGALVQLQEACLALHGERADYIGFDVYCSAWAIAASCGVDAAALLPVIEATVHGVVGKTEGTALPAPLMSGLATLQRMASQRACANLTPVLERIRAMLEERYDTAAVVRWWNDASGPATGNPLYDTLVVIYSCRRYLDTRIAGIRSTWLRDLQARNIPYVVLVGDGDDTLQGDLLALDVPDDYEHLPRKTLAMVRWVMNHTSFQYLLKIDDDCLLDVEQYFLSLSHKKFHYYGRVLKRDKAQFDRVWHQDKSTSHWARFSLDRSPETSVYCNGAVGYTLSRQAMGELLAALDTTTGRRLASVSFMEDKLVGDLLAFRGIFPSEQDYYTHTRRRSYSGAVPVARWDSGCHAGPFAPTKVTHLDTVPGMDAWVLRTRHEVLPKRVWSPRIQAGLDRHNPSLELITDNERLSLLTKVNVIVVAVVNNWGDNLPRFLDSLRNSGVEAFILIDNYSNDGSREYMLEQPDVVVYSVIHAEYRDNDDLLWLESVLSAHCRGKWAILGGGGVVAVQPDGSPVDWAMMIATVEAQGADGALAHLEPAPATADAQRVCLLKYQPWMSLTAGCTQVTNAKIMVSDCVLLTEGAGANELHKS